MLPSNSSEPNLYSVSLGKYHSANGAGTASGSGTSCTEEETMEKILKLENSAAGLLCWLNSHHATQGLDLGFTKDVLGIVATLARVEDDNISRLAFFFVFFLPTSQEILNRSRVRTQNFTNVLLTMLF